MPSRFHEGARQSKLPDRKAARRRRGLDGRQRHRDRDCGSTPLALISLVCCPYLGFGLVRQEKRQLSGAAAYEYGSEAFARRRLNNEEQSGYPSYKCLCRRSESTGQFICQRPLSAIIRVDRI
jgi:hypothetical protein